MLDTGSPMFLLIPTPSKERLLHPGKVLQADGEIVTAELEEQLAPAAGTEVNTFAIVRGKFLQQGAVVVAVEQTEPICVIRLQKLGQAISAENRGTFRVSAINAGMLARIGREKHCAVADISSEGLAVITTSQYAIGSMVDVVLTYEDETFSGKGRVQTVKLLPSGKLRYGLLLPDKQSPIRKAVQKISAEVQRSQLRRLAGAA